MHISCLLTQTEIDLFSHFILHLFSGMPATGSLEPQLLLTSLSTAKQGCAAPREDGEDMVTASPSLHHVPRKHKPLLGQYQMGMVERGVVTVLSTCLVKFAPLRMIHADLENVTGMDMSVTRLLLCLAKS